MSRSTERRLGLVALLLVQLGGAAVAGLGRWQLLHEAETPTPIPRTLPAVFGAIEHIADDRLIVSTGADLRIVQLNDRTRLHTEPADAARSALRPGATVWVWGLIGADDAVVATDVRVQPAL